MSKANKQPKKRRRGTLEQQEVNDPQVPQTLKEPQLPGLMVSVMPVLHFQKFQPGERGLQIQKTTTQPLSSAPASQGGRHPSSPIAGGKCYWDNPKWRLQPDGYAAQGKQPQFPTTFCKPARL